MSFLSRLFRRQAPEASIRDEIFQLLGHSWRTPPRRGTTELLLAYQTSPWLQAILRRIATGVSSSLRWQLWDGPRDDPNRERILSHPMLDLLRNPCTQIPADKFWELVVLHRKLIGEAFLLIDPDKRGRPAKLTPVPPHLVTSLPSKQEPAYKIQQFEGCTYNDSYPASRVIHVRDPDPYDPLGRGAGPGRSLNECIGIFASALSSVNAYFYNGMIPDFMIALTGASDKEIRALHEQLLKDFGGPKRKNKAYLTSRAMQVQRLDTSFRDMALVDIMKWDQALVTQVFGVPPEVMGMLDNANRSTIESADFFLMKYVVHPEQRAICDELQLALSSRFTGNLWLDVENPVPEDKEYQLKCVVAAPSAFTKGEVRQMAGLAPGPACDEPLSESPKVSSIEQVPATTENHPDDTEPDFEK